MKNSRVAKDDHRMDSVVIQGKRTMLLALAAIVVFVVTYLLILPAVTLEEKAAQEMGGIDVPATAENMNFEGDGYSISATAGSDAQLPEGTELTAQEIAESNEDYDAWTDEALKALQDAGLADEDTALGAARFYDITLQADGQIVEPAAPVNVTISYEEAIRLKADDLKVIHFGVDKDGMLAAEILDESAVAISAGKGSKGRDKISDVAFEAPGFSVYAIVEAPDTSDDSEISDIIDLQEGKPYYLSINRNGMKYMTSQTTVNSGVTELKGTPTMNGGEIWYFEFPEENKVCIYYLDSNGEKKYVNTDNSRNFSFSENPQQFNIENTRNAQGTFYIYTVINGKNYALSVRGVNNFFLENRNNGANSYERVVATPIINDPYELDGKTYGIAYHNDSVIAAAMMAEKKDDSHLAAENLVMRPDVLNNSGLLLVSNESDITEWTFHSLGRTDYQITAEVDGITKYLTLDGQSLKLTDAPDDNLSVFTLTAGTGNNKGKYCFTVGDYSIEPNLDGNDTNKGFWGTKSSSAMWLNLVERSVLNDDDFNLYTAKKVSVSDEQRVSDGQKVVIYTRIWNDQTKRYEFYAVDHDGSLIRCYDTGDNIQWIGSQVNTALWDFTEYFNQDGSKNYFYELKNSQYGNYIAPQVTGSQILDDDPIGINLNGRRYGESSTTIIAWDESRYAYAGLKAENGKVVSCPLSEAQDFYFAIIADKDPDDELTTVDTIDNDEYGITMKMVDFNNAVVNGNGNPAPNYNGGRDAGQTAVLGYNTDTAGLLTTDLKENGYPDTVSSKTKKDTASLSTLYEGASPVNHLLIKSIYDESGYFEYDSTQNFAHLDGDTFTVYDQLGSVGDFASNRSTGLHGQFLPYDDLTPGDYCSFTNQTNVLAQELADTDARKGETLYNVGTQANVDYFFGMEMNASFTQTASGLDAWGHDIIFEFSGDDDFWFYVDGELVLDLGGVHSAQAGSINFRTGQITSSRGNTTLYDVFKKNFQARGMTTAEINQKLAEIFTQNENGQYVFKDYTNHTMKMFYMERGAGASNLHMRFNLAAIKPGTFVLSKKLSGTDNPSNDLIEFPYQIWYTSKNDAQEHLLGENAGEEDLVTYEGTSRTVTYKDSFTPSGGSKAYDHVFFLKPGQSATVTLPDDVVDYYVVECGVNPDVYDQVAVNGQRLHGLQTQNLVGETPREDYVTSPATTEERNQVNYDNHVADGAMRALSITKNLFDTDGETPLHYPDDDTEFTFRLYLGNESADEENLPAANLYSYFVKDAAGNYCFFDADENGFRPISWNGSPIHEYSDLAEYLSTLAASQQESIIFKTSMYGTISRIPADHTVEVRDLIVDTKFKVEERDGEIPKGYTRRDADGYVRTDEGHYAEQTSPISGTIEVNNDPKILVQNQIGWGLTAEKVWTDRDFMEQHDDIYFAVYLKRTQGGETLTLLPDTVRRMKTTETEIYYFFDDLHFEGNTYKFDDFVLREVTVDPVTGAVTPIDQGNSLFVGGTPVGGQHGEGYAYTVDYKVGDSTGQNENIRHDVVTNSRPGIKIYKTDWNGEPLGGAVFTLKDANGNNVAAASYISRNSDGLITTAYLNSGTYTLTETAAPKWFTVLDKPMTIQMGRADDDYTVRVSGPDQDLYNVSYADTEMAATITIKNRSTDLQVNKVDATTGDRIPGVHFALYRQVMNQHGEKVRDYLPMTGYEDLVTDENGILPKVTMDLAPGTYYLSETAAAEGYQLLGEDMEFTIGKDGTVTIDTDSYKSWLTRTVAADKSRVSYSILIQNGKMKKVGLKKVSANDRSVVLEGASFVLYRADEFDDDKNGPKEGAHPSDEMTTDENGLLNLGNLALGEYRLVEVNAPDGYLLLDSPVKIVVGENRVTAMQSNSDSDVTAPTDEDDNWRITVWNTSGVELPSSGGPGTTWNYLLGTILLLGCGLTLAARRRTRT